VSDIRFLEEKGKKIRKKWKNISIFSPAYIKVRINTAKIERWFPFPHKSETRKEGMSEQIIGLDYVIWEGKFLILRWGLFSIFL